jgi:hypothetical protein
LIALGRYSFCILSGLGLTCLRTSRNWVLWWMRVVLWLIILVVTPVRGSTVRWTILVHLRTRSKLLLTLGCVSAHYQQLVFSHSDKERYGTHLVRAVAVHIKAVHTACRGSYHRRTDLAASSVSSSWEHSGRGWGNHSILALEVAHFLGGRNGAGLQDISFGVRGIQFLQEQ